MCGYISLKRSLRSFFISDFLAYLMMDNCTYFAHRIMTELKYFFELLASADPPTHPVSQRCQCSRVSACKPLVIVEILRMVVEDDVLRSVVLAKHLPWETLPS